MGSRLGDSGETCTELERYFSDPQLSYHPLLPPRFRNNGIQRSAALLKVPFIALSDYMVKNPYQILNKISLPEKVRKQAGITNRFQITKHLGSDLLGRAQAARAIQVCFNETLQKVLTADVPAAIWKIEENDLCSSPTHVPSYMPYLPKCSSISKTGSPKKPVYYKRRVPEAIKPKEFSCCYSRRLRDNIPTDVILESMDTLWELHSHFLPKSEVLYELLITSDQSNYFMNKHKEARDTCPAGSLYYCGPEGECCESQLQKLKSCNLCNVHERENHWVPLNTRNLKRIISLKLDVKDPFVTQEGFATALGNLYYDEPYVEPEYILSVFAAASVLKFMTLLHKCVSVMLDNINVTTVCYFHRAASKYNQEKLIQACERWMELNLIVHLRYDASLRHLQEEVLQKVLLSPRLFTFTEYHVLQTILCWIFLQVNAEVRLLPPYSTVIAYFISLQKMIVYLEKEIRQKYFGLFQAVRLHGITETRQIEELQQIDLLPRDWLLYVVTRNYYALQHGGDVPCLKYFPSEAVRFGFIITEEPWYHSEMISHCGFYFEIKAVKEKKTSSISFFMQRINPADSSIPFGTTEHNAFSLRHERKVKYDIQVQAMVKEEWQVFSTGYVCQEFGVTKKSSLSKVLLVAGLTMPVYVTFALLFPVS
ncbi:BTB/POZ domain-containing protein 16 isoform X1 [Scyliorhinus canicula]|uniref:BTB/POZ domain-containing protein 16 isoform X1 n=1 Tax=Scyliorhinus canicula TaxID=7830 RepID=UPI0018F74C34|nr:BTB/POZ domain-containing protein 16 isoform X1 [Scyliorhinus canicula]